MKGSFVMEYVGEVFDLKEFKKRRKEYGKDPSNPHFYFMALKSGLDNLQQSFPQILNKLLTSLLSSLCEMLTSS